MNESKAEGVFDQLKGKVEQAFGEATNDQSAANKGAADQVKGHAEETWGNVKDTAHDVAHKDAVVATDHTQTTSHGLREDINSGAEHLKESINNGLDHLKNKS